MASWGKKNKIRSKEKKLKKGKEKKGGRLH